MKIGYAIYGERAYIATGGNKILLPGEPSRIEPNDYYASNCWSTFPKMYPNDIYATIDVVSPDLDICSQLDAIIYYTSVGQDPSFVKVVESIPCKVLFRQDAGYYMMTDITSDEILRNKKIMDLSDGILTSNLESIPLYQMWTDTSVFFWLLPYPVSKVLEWISEYNDQPQFDIVVAYPPVAYTNRNGVVAAVLANKIVETIDGFNTVGIFSKMMANDKREQNKQFLKDMGLANCSLMPRKSTKQAVQVISKSKLVIDLDRNNATGKYAVDCALAKVPAIMSNTLPCARYIYGDAIVQNPYDVSTALSTAQTVVNGKWDEAILDNAYNKALDFAIPNVAKQMEDIIKCLER